MILPWLRGFLNWDHAPLTWSLVGLNVLFFFMTSQVPAPLVDLSREDYKRAGQYYAQMHGTEVPDDPDEVLILGSRALHDGAFFQAVPTFKSNGDAIGFSLWRNKVLEFQSQLEMRPISMFGLRPGAHHPAAWITYQFMHSGLMHIVGNMAMLIIFGVALEVLTNGAMVVGVYLIGGLFGAALFLYLSPAGEQAPMVGASASLSAIMAFYAVIERKKRIRFFYFLSPAPGFWGELYLPTLLIVPLYFVGDLADYLASSDDFGSGVAHTAHIGGALFGISLALILRVALVRFPRWEQTLYASYSRKHTEAP